MGAAGSAESCCTANLSKFSFKKIKWKLLRPFRILMYHIKQKGRSMEKPHRDEPLHQSDIQTTKQRPQRFLAPPYLRIIARRRGYFSYYERQRIVRRNAALEWVVRESGSGGKVDTQDYVSAVGWRWDKEKKTFESPSTPRVRADNKRTGVMFLAALCKPLSLVLGFLWPGYASYKALEGRGTEAAAVWLTYWVVYSCMAVLEELLDPLVGSWMPLYYPLKLALVLWLMLPQTRGASVVYTQLLLPLLRKHEASIDQYLEEGKRRTEAWVRLPAVLLDYMKLTLSRSH
jgi:hypothetical protein